MRIRNIPTVEVETVLVRRDHDGIRAVSIPLDMSLTEMRDLLHDAVAALDGVIAQERGDRVDGSLVPEVPSE